ncbi:A24 family peptidase [Calycomorphotria hydatis]|uniref:Type 4 prepilin-like proteins leader peptide-processing enzyme n=1 Tax=Calycomorphotria hydatis TaxID=2528027 RepID=A0A517TA09_9PLAN|nr:prepilin peptidase [Calycomorphotria hydatis]QDT65208.1 Type 4 prepilin-like proteins leader peptide-processing enzyme [Calycomorphotria hydatis]
MTPQLALLRLIHCLFALFCFAAFVNFIAIPTWDTIDYTFFEQPQAQVLEDLSTMQQMRIRAMELFTASWFFSLGAAIGSYLNVVAYRVPMGKTVFANDSSCPICNSRIKSLDNIPIIGWVRLKGQCRSCGNPISIRYPIVELFCATIFLLLYIVEVLTGADNIPHSKSYFYRGAIWIVWYTKWDVIGFYAYHCLLLCSLLTFTLFAFDGNRTPFYAFAVAAAIGFIPSIIWPYLLPVPVIPEQWEGIITFPNYITPIIGGIVGAGLGILIRSVITHAMGNTNSRDIHYSLALTGMFLGWQAAFTIACVAFLILIVSDALSKLFPVCAKAFSNCACLGATLLLLCFWAKYDNLIYDAAVNSIIHS